MFEYSYDPSEAMLDKKFKFSHDNLQKISNIANDIWDGEEDIYEFLETYGAPFWHIWDGYNKINIEIHAILSDLDKKWAQEHFKEAVDRAVRLLLESKFRN